jgi:hypothetical protein
MYIPRDLGGHPNKHMRSLIISRPLSRCRFDTPIKPAKNTLLAVRTAVQLTSLPVRPLTLTGFEASRRCTLLSLVRCCRFKSLQIRRRQIVANQTPFRCRFKSLPIQTFHGAAHLCKAHSFSSRYYPRRLLSPRPYPRPVSRFHSNPFGLSGCPDKVLTLVS